MELFADVLEAVSLYACLFSVFVLAWGLVRCAISFFRGEFQRRTRREGIASVIRGKNALGFYILLSLEILIAADIIDSIVKPTWEDILLLAAIVTIRTVISHFLNKEIMEGREQLEQEERSAGLSVAAPELPRKSGRG